MKKKLLIFLVLIGLIIAGYLYFAEKEESIYTDYNKDLKLFPEAGKVPERITLPQAWNDQTRKDFWFTSQGSDFMPYIWFTHLEQARNKKLFREASHMESFGYLPEKTSLQNPSGLPIGFAVTRHRKDNTPRGLGLTCAGCHTYQIDYGGKHILVDGAPTLANFMGFFNALSEALQSTHQDEKKFDRFAEKVLADGYPGDKESVRHDLDSVTLAIIQRLEVNALPEGYPKDFASYARVDAFGNIMNAGTAFALHDLTNKNPPTAPVSYPFLWGTHQSDVVQWNASAPNTPIVGPLARNVGEVVGVFGNLSIDKKGDKIKYTSTVDFRGLGELESWVMDLRSPQWPEQYFPKLDLEKVSRGEILYKSKCASCHQVIKREDEGLPYIANRTSVCEIGTDPTAAANIADKEAKTLILEGSKTAVLFGDPFGSESRAIVIPVNGALGLIIQNPVIALKAGLAPSESAGLKQDIKDLKIIVQDHKKAKSMIPTNVLVYKGRPLNGIWATAPYLHNGSIPNLWGLLQKEEDRDSIFFVGNKTFDPIKVGFISTKGPSIFRVYKTDGSIMPGNSNQGHLYGTELTDEEKWALIEYMKTL